MVLLTDYLVFVHRQSGKSGYSTFNFGMPKETHGSYQGLHFVIYTSTMYMAKVDVFFK
jgi:hypothetical protein